MWQPSEVKTASPKSSGAEPREVLRERGAPADLRALAGDLERALRRRSPAAARRSRARARAGRPPARRRRPARRRGRAPSHSSVVSARRSSSGSAAAATASSAARPTEARPTRPLAAEARARRARAALHQHDALRGAEDGEQRRGRPGGALRAGREADGQPGLERPQRGPGHARQRLAADPVGRQRRAPRDRAVGVRPSSGGRDGRFAQQRAMPPSRARRLHARIRRSRQTAAPASRARRASCT